VKSLYGILGIIFLAGCINASS